MAPVPAWNNQGLIPPIDEGNPVSPDRSPYLVSLTDVVHRFATSLERITILDGLLRYRAALHATNLTTGFQWLDGSFLEHVELLEERPPHDIDVVTFYTLPLNSTQQTLLQANPVLFQHHAVKDAYQVDGYLVSLQAAPHRLVERSAYWYSMWSHRRSAAWKGYLQVDLDPADDPAAAAVLLGMRLPLEDSL